MQKSKMFFEDFEVGLVIKTGSKKITKKEIISFAKNYDPQDFHIDENKAKKGPFWNTCLKWFYDVRHIIYTVL